MAFQSWLSTTWSFLNEGLKGRFPCNLERLARTRPRKAMRSMYPGLSRTKILSLCQAYHPASYEQNLFKSRLRQYQSSRSQHTPNQFSISKYCRLRLQDIWLSDHTSIIFDELCSIILSLLFMIGIRTILFVIYAMPRLTVRILRPLLHLPRCFLCTGAQNLRNLSRNFLLRRF